MMSDWNNKRILISRTDSIGDVLLTLPICEWLKKKYPEVTLLFLGRTYTQSIIEAYDFVDEVINWDTIQSLPTVDRMAAFRALNVDVIVHIFPNKDIASLAKKVKIPTRIGTSHRSFHLLTCNHRLNFTRKNSNLHEAQLNFELLKPFGLKQIPTLEEINQSTAAFHPSAVELPQNVQSFISQHSKYVILHPKSQGSALEWPIEKYVQLAKKLVEKGYGVAYTGTDKEGVNFRGNITTSENIMDTTGLMTLEQLMRFIQQASGIVACSTGPLHIGGFLGIKSIGLFSNRKPIHPGRWHAIGSDAHYIVNDENCELCKKGKPCKCIENIEVERVATLF